MCAQFPQLIITAQHVKVVVQIVALAQVQVVYAQLAHQTTLFKVMELVVVILATTMMVLSAYKQPPPAALVITTTAKIIVLHVAQIATSVKTTLVFVPPVQQVILLTHLILKFAVTVPTTLDQLVTQPLVFQNHTLLHVLFHLFHPL